jgi:hypothetical protein
MTTKQELYKIIDELNEAQLDYAKETLTNISQGKLIQKIPVCDLGSPEDIATLYESVTYDKNNKM